MRVAEFIDTYPIESTVPPIQDSLYGAARRRSHQAGEATINALQGETITRTQQAALCLNDTWKIRNAFYARYHEDAHDESELQTEYAHFSAALLGGMLHEQYKIINTNPSDEAFDFAYQSSVVSVALIGLQGAMSLERGRQTIPLRQFMNRVDTQSMIGVLNEYEATLALLGLAKAKRPERRLTVLPAPPHVEWYKPKNNTSKGNNLHADLLVVDSTDPDDRKVACIQVKSFAQEETSDSYNNSKVMLLCGRTDLDNRISEDGRSYSWPGRMTIKAASEVILNNKLLIQTIKKGHIGSDFSVAVASRYRADLKKMKKRTIDYASIYERLWPRLEKALDN